jgi:DNA-binding MarR family transcriptional regulator
MEKPTPTAAAVTTLILEVFRLNGALLEAGDALVRDTGLTSARWQVLGAIAASPVPLPVAHIARNMGLTRQAVQRLANELESDGLVRFDTNPHHERAKLVVMTKAGERAYAVAMRRQAPWANRLAGPLSAATLSATARVLADLYGRLDGLDTGSTRHKRKAGGQR